MFFSSQFIKVTFVNKVETINLKKASHQSSLDDSDSKETRLLELITNNNEQEKGLTMEEIFLRLVFNGLNVDIGG